MARFQNAKAPFLRLADTKGHSTKDMMIDLLIALSPVIIFSFLHNGLIPYIHNEINFYRMIYPLLLLLVGGLSSLIFEIIALLLMNKDINSIQKLKEKLNVSFPIIPGILLVCTLPPYTPLWIIVIGSFFATIVGKMIYGGFGCNLFNPALVGHIIVAAAFTPAINAVGASLQDIKAVTGATPLAYLAEGEISYQKLVTPFGTLFNLFLGINQGAFGETSGIACLIGLIYLLVRRVINWRIPVFYLGTIFIFSWIIGAFNGTYGLWFPTYNVITGGAFFAGVYMITEPVTSPRGTYAKDWYAIFAGVLTMLFRFNGLLPEGVATAILTANLFVPIFDNAAAKVRANGLKKAYKPLLAYLIILLLIAAYTIYRSTGIYYTVKDLIILRGWM